MEKSADAYRTISEVAEELKLPQHVLRFWETRFPQIKPMKRGGNRRFYRPGDVELLRAIKTLLYGDGFTIKGVQRILKEQGPRAVANLAQSGQLRNSVKPNLTQSHDADEMADGPQGVDDRSESSPPSGPEPSLPRSEFGRSVSPPAVPTSAIDSSKAGMERAGTTEGLQAVLSELSECRRILAAACA